MKAVIHCVVAVAGRLQALLWVGTTVCGLAACMSTPESPPPMPYASVPADPPPYVDRVPTGAIYQASVRGATLFSNTRLPRRIGDSLKIDIEDKLTATRKLTSDMSRESKLVSKGPGGGGSGSTLVDKILNINATASGNDSYKGKGEADNSSSFSGQLAASVINVLPNGYLVVAGERKIAMNGGSSVLRFSGVVNPQDIKNGNVIASTDVVNANVELGGQGDISESASRNWLQRVLTHYVSVW